MELQNDPLKAMRETLKTVQFQDPLKEVREALKAVQFQDPLKEVRETLKTVQFQDPLKEVREALKAVQFQDPLKEWRETLKAVQFQDPLKEVRETLKTVQFQDPLKEVREALRTLAIGTTINAISREKWLLPDDGPAKEELTVSSDGSITFESTTVSYEDIRSIADQVVERALNRRVRSIEDVVREIISEIRALQNPALEKVLTWLVFPVIVGFIFSVVNPIADFYVKEYLSVDKRQLEKQIKKQVVKTVGNDEQLDLYRLVSVNALNVRSKPSNKAPLLGKLHFGQVVTLSEKGRDWSRITWSDEEDGVKLQGWVFSRYLEKFR